MQHRKTNPVLEILWEVLDDRLRQAGVSDEQVQVAWVKQARIAPGSIGEFWSTSFRISPRGDWIVITMSQLAFDKNEGQGWLTQYEKIAAEAIVK